MIEPHAYEIRLAVRVASLEHANHALAVVRFPLVVADYLPDDSVAGPRLPALRKRPIVFVEHAFKSIFLSSVHFFFSFPAAAGLCVVGMDDLLTVSAHPA